MMDERLIGEVQKHAIIYNRQKSNMINGDKSASKELAWANIAIVLATDADSCKKRWKYLRERYVQQKKVGDSPSYEHLSRPYLEKMKFLDNFIQPRKSYRNVNHLFPSPNSSQQNLLDGHDESSTERSIPMNVITNYHHHNQHSNTSTAADHLQHQFSDTIDNHKASSSMAATVENAYQYYYQTMQQQQQHRQQDISTTATTTTAAATAIGVAGGKKSTDHRHIPPAPAPDLIKMENCLNIASSSSSMISQSSPSGPIILNNGGQSSSSQIDCLINNDTIANDVDTQKRRRTTTSILEQSLNNHNLSDADEQTSCSNNDAENDGGESSTTTINNNNHHHQRSPQFPSDFLYPFYQHAQRQIRNSEQLLGELVTSELLKMSKDRKKIAQKKILEILFFDD